MERNVPSCTFARDGEIGSRGESALGALCPSRACRFRSRPGTPLSFLPYAGRNSQRAPIRSDLRHEVVVRLTYTVGEGPRPDIVRWFLVKEEVQRFVAALDMPHRWRILAAHRRRFGMKNPVYEQIQARKVKARLRMLQHAKRLSGNVSQTCR